MSDNEASENGRCEEPEFSLTQTVEEIRHLGFAQVEKLREKQKILSSLQANLSEIQKKAETVEQDLRARIRDILVQEAGIEQLEQQKKVLDDRRTSISKEKAGLERRRGEEEEEVWKALAQFSTYRKKMEGHRAAASQAEAQKVLEEKREELREDLEKVVQVQASKFLRFLSFNLQREMEALKVEVEALKVEVEALKKTAAERMEELLKEAERQAQIREDTEIQNRRFEAVVRRLQLQLSRAQAAHGQVCEDVRCMETELAELKKRL